MVFDRSVLEVCPCPQKRKEIILQQLSDGISPHLRETFDLLAWVIRKETEMRRNENDSFDGSTLLKVPGITSQRLGAFLSICQNDIVRSGGLPVFLFMNVLTLISMNYQLLPCKI